jgi:hypothetical protein
MPSHKRYSAAGKQVLIDGAHYGDMIDENAATCAADALNGADEQASWSTIIAQVK